MQCYVTIMTKVVFPLLFGGGDMQTDLRSDAVRNNRDKEQSDKNRSVPCRKSNAEFVCARRHMQPHV